MAFRIATSPSHLGWRPAEFWNATLVEFNLALEGLTGGFQAPTAFSREAVRRIAAASGKSKSIRKLPTNEPS
ncbi:phage tail assembly chaperone [Mycoplana rhizolycopersici]|uniref:Phage tail assembly chaperone n=1 Tax=Mycoplana rhizolycopersici TaxID=2746702 RepID=A0ABX2Q9P9_9HYPH|nr:phage tail assembly chaperone [Rhizobium rhizolycopersici]NVP54457.1 phage tail assembly chaperone [Rhizobium rhizolycopersici]